MLYAKMVAAITDQHKLISSTKEMNPIMRKSVSRLAMLFCCRAVHQNPVERPTLGKPENKRCNPPVVGGGRFWDKPKKVSSNFDTSVKISVTLRLKDVF